MELPIPNANDHGRASNDYLHLLVLAPDAELTLHHAHRMNITNEWLGTTLTGAADGLDAKTVDVLHGSGWIAIRSHGRTGAPNLLATLLIIQSGVPTNVVYGSVIFVGASDDMKYMIDVPLDLVSRLFRIMDTLAGRK